jgi:hypothetical protein
VLRPSVSSAGAPARPKCAGMFASLVAVLAAAASLSGVTGQAEVPARPDPGTLVGPAVTVAARAFPAGRRFVTATVSARHRAGSSGRATMLSVELACGAESVQATTNVLTTAVLAPRRIMRDATGCTVVARSAVDSPTALDGLRVTATLSAVAVASGATGYAPAGFPTLLRPGGRLDVTPAVWTAPAGARSMTVAGDVKVTACTSVGGSRENGSPYLCAPARVKPAGARLQVSLVGQQKAAGGGYCRVVTLSTRTVRVDRAVHHAMVAQRGTFTLSTARGCTRTVRVKQYAQVLPGADVVLHRRGTITSVYR